MGQVRKVRLAYKIIVQLSKLSAGITNRLHNTVPQHTDIIVTPALPPNLGHLMCSKVQTKVVGTAPCPHQIG